MHLIQLLLPLRSPSGKEFSRELFDEVRHELTRRFGGLTAYSRNPAEGLWQTDEQPPVRDDIVVYEVMAESVDRPWWASFRRHLEQMFEQESIVVRASRCELL